MTPAARLALALASVLLPVTKARAQANPAENYTRRNTFTIFAEYANDSSHIVLGNAPNRKFSAAGVQYQRLLTNRHGIAWSYAAEFRPLIFESDPPPPAPSRPWEQ